MTFSIRHAWLPMTRRRWQTSSRIRASSGIGARVEAAIRNAKAFLAVQGEFGSFDWFLWGFVEGRPIKNRWRRLEEIPARTRESDAMSEGLRGRGFSFVGSTICYAFMQASGMVNDHTTDCFRWSSVS